MSDWVFLNAHRLRFGTYGTTAEDGFNGAFQFAVPGEARRVCVIASDGLGWEHVSVSFGQQSFKTPSWEVMDHVRRLFWPQDAWVVQFHPPASEHVNNHPGCLHMWRCTDGREQPTPDSILVGYKLKEQNA